ncbi:zinc finger protein OZF-like [Chironomus tepperi]|uniref:zinc finger protein OZF-like n=1 Tax=Chironomus tepperi TaxID=113505 RepID=UPI00391EF791
MKCMFCLNFLDENNLIHINDRLDENNEIIAADLIRIHFPFAEKILRNSENEKVCHNCWYNIDSFHEFFTLVANNYGMEPNIKYDVGSLDVEDTDALKTEDLIVYEIDAKDDKEIFDENLIKEETSELDETITEWISEEHPQYTPKTKFDLQYFNENDTADDQRIRETANMLCDLCSIPIESLRDAKSHFKHAHQMEGYLMCCNRKFRQRCRLVEHVNTHYNYSYPCPICGKTFDSKSYLSKHLACHETIKEYKCDHCPKSFAKKFQVRNHLLSVHIFDNVEAIFECPIQDCFKKFVNQARLKHHIDYTHAATNMEICEICSKTFKTKSAIEEHKKTHLRKPEDRIKCEICGHYLGDLKSYNRHVKNHATEAQENQCSYCGKKSPNLNALKKHIRYVHEMPKNFTCKYCDKSFKRPRNLIDHEASVHTLQDLYTCTFCPRTFRNQSNMLSHRKKQHPDQYQKPSYMRDDVVV